MSPELKHQTYSSFCYTALTNAQLHFLLPGNRLMSGIESYLQKPVRFDDCRGVIRRMTRYWSAVEPSAFLEVADEPRTWKFLDW